MGKIVTVALLIFLSFSSMGTESAREHFKFAKFSYDAQEYDKALDYVSRAIEISPDYSSALILRIEINRKLQNYNAMLADAKHVLAIENLATSILAQAYLLKGIAYFKLGELGSAESDFKTSVSLNADGDETYFFQGLIRYHQGQLFQALENMDKAIRLNGNNHDYFYYRAKVKIENYHPLPETKIFDSIMADISMAINLDPEDHRAYKLKCDMLRLNSTKTKNIYIEELSKSIDLFPDQADFYAQRGMANILNYSFEEALSDLNQAISLDAVNELNLRNRAICHHNLGHYGAAIDDFTSSIDLLIKKYQDDQQAGSKNLLAETLVLRGRTYQEMRSPDDACLDFYNAAKLGSKTGLNNYRRNCNVYN